MNTLDPSLALQGVTSTVQTTPREVSPAVSARFRELMSVPEAAASAPASAPGSTQATGAIDKLGLDIERALTSHLPPANASTAEFAIGLLRAQVAVSQAALGIELLSKSTQSLSQGVQSLTTRS